MLNSKRSRASARSHAGPFPGGQRSQTPQGPSPPVAQPGLVLPAPVVAHAVVDSGPSRPGHRPGKPDSAPAKATSGGSAVGLAAQHHQAPCDVVDAVPVLTAGNRPPGVLEQPGVVAQPEQMVERDAPGRCAPPVRSDRTEQAASPAPPSGSCHHACGPGDQAHDPAAGSGRRPPPGEVRRQPSGRTDHRGGQSPGR